MAGALKHLGLSGITRRSALWCVTGSAPYILLGNYVSPDNISFLTALGVDLATAMILKDKPRLHPPYPDAQLFDYLGLRSPGTSRLATTFGARVYTFTGSKEFS